MGRFPINQKRFKKLNINAHIIKGIPTHLCVYVSRFANFFCLCICACN